MRLQFVEQADHGVQQTLIDVEVNGLPFVGLEIDHHFGRIQGDALRPRAIRFAVHTWRCN